MHLFRPEQFFFFFFFFFFFVIMKNDLVFIFLSEKSVLRRKLPSPSEVVELDRKLPNVVHDVIKISSFIYWIFEWTTYSTVRLKSLGFINDYFFFFFFFFTSYGSKIRNILFLFSSLSSIVDCVKKKAN